MVAWRGEADRAFEWLDKAVQYNDPGLSEIPVAILFTNIHDDPHWLPFLESIGKSPVQLAAIEFNVMPRIGGILRRERRPTALFSPDVACENRPTLRCGRCRYPVSNSVRRAVSD